MIEGYKRVRKTIVETINKKEINLFIKKLSENLTPLIKKPKDIISFENKSGKYESAYDTPHLISQKNSDDIIFIALITFHHKEGSVVECTFPQKDTIIKNPKTSIKDLIDYNNPKQNTIRSLLDSIYTDLTNYCLMDGMHLINQGTNIFFLHQYRKPIYCISYYIQKQTNNNGIKIVDNFQEDIRGCFQKSLCIVSLLPFFSNIITYQNYYTILNKQMDNYMNQESLDDKKEIMIIYDKLKNEYNSDNQWMFNIRKVFCLLKEDLLILLKYIILEKKIVIYSQIPSNACLFIITLLSIYPCELSQSKTKFDLEVGLPFKVFHDNFLIQPLFTLFDLDNLLDKMKQNKNLNYIIGISNAMIVKNTELNWDCYVNIDELKIQYKDNDSYLKIINGRESKFLEKISDLIFKDIGDPNQKNNIYSSKKPKINVDEKWIINFENEKLRDEFYQIKKIINTYYLKICYDISYLTQELTKKFKNNKNLQKINIQNEVIQFKYFKCVSKDYISDGSEEIRNEKELNSYTSLPELEELISEPTIYYICSILPLNFDSLLTASEKTSKKENNAESILSKVNNLAFISEWTSTKNFIKWFCSYEENITNFSTLNNNETNTKIYDYDNNFYSGPMHFGKKNGIGILSYKDGKMTYNGNFKNDLRNGKGTFIAEDKKYYYEGEWLNDVMEGKGSLSSNVIGKYVGEFHKDLFEGKGNLIELNGDIYSGSFYKGKKYGKGELKLNNGSLYTGYFKNNKYHGKGKLVDSNGKVIFEGIFKEGILFKTKSITKEDKNTNSSEKNSEFDDTDSKYSEMSNHTGKDLNMSKAEEEEDED